METGTFVSVAILASRELAEIAGSLGHDIVVELEDDAAGGFAADGDIELKIREKNISQLSDVHRIGDQGNGSWQLISG